ncbi:MAG TPA: ribosome maturation factor RimM [Flavobacteriales bacterium]
MDLDSLHRIGRLGKPWGHQGELTLHLEGVDPEDIIHHGALFVAIDGQRVPFFFTKLYDKGRETLIKFDEFADPQAAGILVGCEVFAPPGHLVDGSDESWDPEEFVGLLVKDEEHGELGEVVAIEGTDTNLLLVVLQGEREILVPLVDEMIVGIDPEEGFLIVRTPEGLIDLNTKGA